MIKGFRPAARRPTGFEDFWRKTLRELDGVEADVRLGPHGHAGEGGAEARPLSFRSLGGVRVHGYMLRGAGGSRPLVVHAHGYGSRCEIQWGWARAGLDVLGVDIRGFGRSRDALPDRSDGGYVLTGIGSPETSVLRGAACDYLRAARIGRALRPRAPRTVLYGRSFGGGLALMAEGAAGLADLLAVGVPTFGWAEGRRFFVKDGSGQEINAFLDAHPDQTDDVMLVLGYFDTVHFAGLIGCPALVGIGLHDPVVPPETVYPIADSLAGPVEVMEFPVSHTDRPEEAEWDRFESRWEALALGGVPASFGRTART